MDCTMHSMGVSDPISVGYTIYGWDSPITPRISEVIVYCNECFTQGGMVWKPLNTLHNQTENLIIKMKERERARHIPEHNQQAAHEWNKLLWLKKIKIL